MGKLQEIIDSLEEELGMSKTPRLPGRACRWPGCPEIVRDRSEVYCKQHRTKVKRKHNKAYDDSRGTSSERGYDADWQRFRKWFLAQPGNQWCYLCLKDKGKYVRPDVIHHIIPVSERFDLRLVASNCQALCHACHNEIHRK